MAVSKDVLAREIARLSAFALTHRLNVGRKFYHNGLAFVGSIRDAKVAERAAENLARQLQNDRLCECGARYCRTNHAQTLNVQTDGRLSHERSRP